MVIEDLVKTVLTELRTTTKIETIIGDPIQINDISIVPVTKVSFGFGVGGGKGEKEIKGGGEATGGGLSIEPVAFLVIREDKVELISVKKGDSGLGKIIELIPQISDKFKSSKNPRDKKQAHSSKENKEK